MPLLPGVRGLTSGKDCWQGTAGSLFHQQLLGKNNCPAATTTIGTWMNISSTDTALIPQLISSVILIPQYPWGVVYLGGFGFALFFFFFENKVKNNITVDKWLPIDPFPSPKIITGHTQNNGICTDNFFHFLLIFTHFFRETKFPRCGINRIQWLNWVHCGFSTVVSCLFILQCSMLHLHFSPTEKY